MDLQISQILSNFKLFSQNDETVLNKMNTLSSDFLPSMEFVNSKRDSTLKYKLTLGFLIAVIFSLVYFRREELTKVIIGWISVAGLNDFLADLWLKTHLTSTGEVVSTYVPDTFSAFLGNSTE